MTPFPEGSTIQNTFSFQTVFSCLQVLSDDSMTIFQAGLCPAAKLYFGSGAQGPFLRPEIAALEGDPVGPASHLPRDDARSRDESERLTGGAKAGSSTVKPENGDKKMPKWLKIAQK